MTKPEALVALVCVYADSETGMDGPVYYEQAPTLAAALTGAVCVAMGIEVDP